jgi:hypothetical protein
MKYLTTNVCLTFAVIIGSMGVSESADFQKGLTAAQSGDFATARREWTPLAEQGLADAQFNLGLMYDDGKGVPEDDREAVKWYRLAAKQGAAYAQSNLGLMYQKGHGVPQDYKTAAKWYRLAAKQGVAAAQGNLGLMFGKGQGVRQDYKTAVEWYKLAAEQGFAAAQGNLGVMYAFGTGVLKDYVYAHMWGNIAATNGHALGAKLRDDFEKNMTSTQIVEALKLGQECIQKKYKGCIKNSSKSKQVAERSSLKSIAVTGNERLRREKARLKKQNQFKPKQVSERSLEKKSSSISSSYPEKNAIVYNTKLSGLVVSLEDNGFLLDAGFGKFSIQLKGSSYEPIKGDDVTVIGNTNELYAQKSIVFAEKIMLRGRNLKSGSVIKRNITDGWISLSGRVSSIFGDIIQLDADEKIIISLKHVKFSPPIQIGSLVAASGYLTKDNNGEVFVKAKNIIKLSR